MTHERRGAWSTRIAPWARNWAPDPERLAQLLKQARRALRDDLRSRVLLVSALPGAPAGDLVAKRPLWRDGRTWNRLASLLTRGEMRRAFDASLRLEELGIRVPRPVSVMERRRLGMLLESWFLYEYAEGRPVSDADWPAVIETVQCLHAAGLRHGDPHLANWLAAPDGGVIMLDPGPRLLRGWMADDAYDFVLLRNCQPRMLPLLPLQHSWRWRLAELRNAGVQSWRKLKRILRGT